VFDRNAFVTKLEEGFAEADLTPEQSTCVREALKFAEYEDLEAVIIEGESALVDIVADC
jgi:hypothetical protein